MLIKLVSDVLVLTSTHELYIRFSPPIMLRRGSEKMIRWASGGEPQLTHHTIVDVVSYFEGSQE